MYRFNPTLVKEGKNPFTLDSKAPSGDLRAFLRGEVRYSALESLFPEEAKTLHDRLESEFAEQYAKLAKLAGREEEAQEA